MKTKILLILCLFSAAAQAQFVTNSKRVADVYFQNKEYYAAAEYYKKALQIDADRRHPCSWFCVTQNQFCFSWHVAGCQQVRFKHIINGHQQLIAASSGCLNAKHGCDLTRDLPAQIE